MARRAVLLALLLGSGCRAPQASEPPEPRDTASEPADALQQRELAMRYAMALSLFDRGDYESAAALFTQVLLELPRDPSGDVLRHALIQHVAWSLLGSFDALGRGADIVERVRLDLTWEASGLAAIEIVGTSELDPPATSCVRAALRTAERSLAHASNRGRAQLDLTFFVDFERRGPGKRELDTDRFGPIEDFKPRGVPWEEL